MNNEKMNNEKIKELISSITWKLNFRYNEYPFLTVPTTKNLLEMFGVKIEPRFEKQIGTEEGSYDFYGQTDVDDITITFWGDQTEIDGDYEELIDFIKKYKIKLDETSLNDYVKKLEEEFKRWKALENNI